MEEITVGIGQINIQKTWEEVFDSRNLLRIAQQLGHQWKPLATFLKFERASVENFSANTHIQQDAALTMLTTYRDGSPMYGTRRQIEEFVIALKEAKLFNIAATITGQTEEISERPLERNVNAHQAGGERDERQRTEQPKPIDPKDRIEVDMDFYVKTKNKKGVYSVNDHVSGSQPRGIAIIINILKGRKGAEKDQELMESLFKQLGYKLIVQRDGTKEIIMSKLKEIAADPQLLGHDSIVIFLMAHGQSGQIFDVNDYCIHYDELFEVFSNDKCRHLEGKPKLYFFQSCRGVLTEYDTQNDKEDSDANMEADSVQIRSRKSDVLVSFATVPDQKAYRDQENGSRYVKAIWQVFKEDAKDSSVLQLLTRVNGYMHEHLGTYHYDGAIKQKKARKQCADMHSTLLKDFYFFPRAQIQ